MAACDEALALPELVECILSQLPMRDLLLAQRVCKTWQTIIKLKPLQRKLFFEEIPGGPLNFVHTPVESPFGSVHNPDRLRKRILCLEDYNRQVYHPPGKGLAQDAGLEYMWTMAPVPGAPSFTDERRPIPIYENPVLMELHAQMNRMTLTSTKLLVSLPESWLRPEASWRRMLVASPTFTEPCVLVTVVRQGRARIMASFGDPTDSVTYRQLGSMFDELVVQSRANCTYRTELSLVDGLRVETQGRELWEVPLDGGWNRIRDSDADTPMHQIMLKEQLQDLRQ